MDFMNLKHYWIFFATLIIYCIGFIVHFIAQYSGTHARNEKEILREASTNTKLVHNTFTNTTSTTSANVDVDSPFSDYTSPTNLFYFAQISDIHISYDFTKGAQGHLYYFLKRIIPVVEPQFLFITGDITNSKKNGGYTVGTDEDEWKLYRKILEQTGVLLKNNGTFLWDLRGNHDCFMIPEWSSPFNFFKNYSKTGTRGFSFHYETSFGSTYSFIGLDGCPVFTVANPFFGIIDEVTMDAYTEFMDHAKANPKNRHNFVFIHYPETTAKFGKSSFGKRWEDYTKNISLLLTGHFHSLVGDQIYAYHKNYLELELSDLKIHGKYRLVSIDHDIVSFSDYTLPLPELPYDFKTSNLDDIIHQPPIIFNQTLPPIVLITSPKNSRFILETNREPVKESISSEYIRVLVFSSVLPTDLKLSLFIDDKEQQDITFNFVGESNQEEKIRDKREESKKRSWNKIVNIYSREENIFNMSTSTTTNTTSTTSLRENNQTLVESNKIPPLWIAKWNPSTTILNPNKSYELKVVALDQRNNLKGNHSITFRFDGQKEDLNIPLRGQLLLKSVFVKLLPILFGIVYISYEVMILLSRFYAVRYIIPKHSNLPFLPNRYVGDLIFNETKSFRQTFFKKHFILPFIEAFTLNGIFYPLQIFVLCLLVFPSKVGLMSRSSEHFSRICGEFLYGFYGSGQWSNTFDQYGTFMVIFLLIPYLNTFLIVFTNHRRHRNSILTFILLILIGGIQLAISISSSYKRGGILTILLSPFPIWICLYCWFLLILIIIRRFKNSKSTMTTELT